MKKTAPLSLDKVFSHFGFTLVELLIVITIILITTAAIIPNFSSYLRNQAVKQGSEQVKSDLRNVQNKALTGALSELTLSGNPVTHWGVRFGPGSGTGTNTYEFFVSANTACPASFAAGQLQGNASVSTTLQIKTNQYSCIFFSITNGDIIHNLPSDQVLVGYVGSSASGDCRRILFNDNGLIYSSNSVSCTP